MFPHLQTRITDAVAKLEEKIALADSEVTPPSEEDLTKANSALEQGREALKAAKA